MKPSIQARQFVLAEGPSPSAPLPDGEAPPPYNTLPPPLGAMGCPSAPPDGGGKNLYPATWQDIASSGINMSPQHSAREIKLGYMDFVPRLLRKRFLQDNEYETFSTLIQRANDWLEEHPWISVLSCETIAWSGLKTSKIYSDASCFERSISAAMRTKNLIGMRLWFLQDTFPNHSQPSSPAVIECRTFIPRHDTETFDHMIERINQVLNDDPLSGSIFSVEVVPIACRTSDYRPGNMNPNICFWREDPEMSKIYIMCVRIYAKLVPNKCGRETIGYKTFVPQYNGQSKENKGYEVFSSMMERASRWISSQRGVRFVSVKSVNVKFKKKGSFEERCVFTEHLCAKNRENILTGISSTTKYLRTLRAFYVLNINHAQSDIAQLHDFHSSQEAMPPLSDQAQVRLTSRTFVPAQISVITSSVPVNMCNPSPYEETRKVLERINQWLSITGAKIFHVETISLRQTAISQLQTLGPDATFSQNSLQNTRSNVEHWIHYIRFYLDGEYREPPGAISLVVPSVRPFMPL